MAIEIIKLFLDCLTTVGPQQPCLTKDDMYLLYDFVHLLKNIRNNWLMENMGELAFYERGMKKVSS